MENDNNNNILKYQIMNYLLVDKKQLADKNIYPDAEELSDGRVVLSINALKVVTNLQNVEIIDDRGLEALLVNEKELKRNEEEGK